MFSGLNGFTMVIFGAIYSLLFGVSLTTVLTYNGYLLQILTWIESCLIGTHTTSSYFFFLLIIEVLLNDLIRLKMFSLVSTMKCSAKNNRFSTG